ncbi:ABC transporter substrate-binding protein [Nakamurella endophytica]|uniref:ABC transporter substrate-binding protein n=1 Tax=Nakamurella endophytica TaxID=1748367 RepID=A0A917TBX2_9ACTN|nr:ABC transporter substrate-binding protein [Nakamurella endophytica]GGM16677.1 ABC transporter substrate-binding protein [Nakamurella endophytica]
MRELTRRQAFSTAGWLTLGLAGGKLLAGCGSDSSGGSTSGGADAGTVRFAYQPGFAYGLYYVAQQKGWLTSVKLDPMTLFSNGTTQIDAVVNGNFDATVQGFVPILTRAAAGQPVRIIDVVDNSGRTYAVVGNGDIDGLEGLKGKKVGINQGSNYDYFLSQALQQAQMTKGDLQLINFADPAKAQAAFLAKQVDAIVPITTNRDAILKQRPDAKVVFSATEMSGTPFAIYDLMTTTADGLSAHRSALAALSDVFHTKVYDYVTGSTQSQAVDDLYNWQTQVVKAEVAKDDIAKNIKAFDFYPKKDAADIVGGGKLQSFLESIAQFLVAGKVLDKVPDIKSIIDAGVLSA